MKSLIQRSLNSRIGGCGGGLLIFYHHLLMRLLCLFLGVLLSTLAWADLPRTGGNHPTVMIEKQCEGHSIEAAKKSCFQSAIEQVVGQIIVSDLEVSGDMITKDNIARYSSGYIDDYLIYERRQDENGWWHLKMKISIASSKIAQRKTSRAEHSYYVDGGSAMDSMESQIEQRNRGDALIGQVLSSYPENAYVINSGQTEFKVSNLRQAYVDVPYSITMSRPWVEALNEALDLVAVNTSKCNELTMAVLQGVQKQNPKIGKDICGGVHDISVSYKAGFFFSDTFGYYFPDLETQQMINNELRTGGQQHIGLRVDLLDAGGNILDSRCARINNERFIRYERPAGTYNLRDSYTNSRPRIFGQENVYGVLQVNIKNTQQMQELAKIKLTVQRTCT
jgi:hypothetical protein